MHRLHNTIRDYPWGSRTLMADFLNLPPSGRPEAEMWLGAHPGAPSIAECGDQESRLDELILEYPEALLGDVTQQAFGDRLPFLMKLLAAESPLSLQVHPTLEQAAAGFADEEAGGTPRDAAHRNYRDSNHKPEMILALTEFAALCGFRTPADTATTFSLIAAQLPESEKEASLLMWELHDILCNANISDDAGSEALRAAFTRLVHGGPTVTRSVHAVTDLLDNGQPPETQSSAELAAAAQLGRCYPGDPGVLISLMLNLVTLAPGDAVFLPAGNIHAYLHGLGIEVMASSDNVLRGGLTTKHVDTAELLRTVEFQPLPVPLIEPSAPRPGEQVWAPPSDEFQLQRFDLAQNAAPVSLPPGYPAIVLVTAGNALLTSSLDTLTLEPGDSAFIRATEHPVTLQPRDSEASVAFATTPSVLRSGPSSHP